MWHVPVFSQVPGGLVQGPECRSAQSFQTREILRTGLGPLSRRGRSNQSLGPLNTKKAKDNDDALRARRRWP